MAYPTGVSFQPTSGAPLGMQPIGATSTTKLHELGTRVRATDVSYGEGEFVYLLGVASTAKGDVVCFNSKTGATVRAVAGGATSVGSVAVAMSDNVASQHGWYCVDGSVPVSAATVAADTQAYLTASASQVDDAASASAISGMVFKAATVSGYATAQLAGPTVSTLAVTTASFGTSITTPLIIGGAADGSLTLRANNAASMTDPVFIFDTAAALSGYQADAYVFKVNATSMVTFGSIGDVNANYLVGAQGMTINSGAAPRFLGSDASGTPGSATINSAGGQFAIAAGQASATITNNLVAATTVVICVLQFADATLNTLRTVVPGAGSFVVTGNANATANTKVGFILLQTA